MAERVEDLVRLGPEVWPGKVLDVQPGDLSKFAPQGLGLSTPLLMMPWDTVDAALERTSYYDFDRPATHPFHAAPTAEAAGGTLYFAPPQPGDFEAALRLLAIRIDLNEYAAFVGHSKNTLEDRYLSQLRIVSKFALANLYQAPISEEDHALIQQPLCIGDLLWRFVTQQQAYWSHSENQTLAGKLGGDGDWARESLAFGLMVENAYHCVYRIWSRPWLVTK